MKSLGRDETFGNQYMFSFAEMRVKVASLGDQNRIVEGDLFGIDLSYLEFDLGESADKDVLTLNEAFEKGNVRLRKGFHCSVEDALAYLDGSVGPNVCQDVENVPHSVGLDEKDHHFIVPYLLYTRIEVGDVVEEIRQLRGCELKYKLK